MWKVLEILVQGAEKSWNILGYDMGGRHNDAGADGKHLRKLAKILSVYTKKSPAAGAFCI